jgi:hypothetical protein
MNTCSQKRRKNNGKSVEKRNRPLKGDLSFVHMDSDIPFVADPRALGTFGPVAHSSRL